ncbi:hypothetical protein Tco_0841811 [Tanacetum coccineum]|uniref:Reverse transcriptase domain-containing protein n=1 Tax=Tanacetum coccineum TaxID=301880 RepID=A0ABQ5B1V7_9ASTR
MEDQPLPADASPTALSPGYIADFDPEEDEEDPEEDPADHPVDGGDNDDNESSDDDNDDDDWWESKGLSRGILAPDERTEVIKTKLEVPCRANKKEHEEHLKQILELLKKEELYAKFSKCVILDSKDTVPQSHKVVAVHQSLHYLKEAKISCILRTLRRRVWGAVLIADDEKVISYASRQLKINEKKTIDSYLELGSRSDLEKQKLEPRADGGNHFVPKLAGAYCDRETRVAIQFLEGHLPNALGTNLDMSTAYHPTNDGQKREDIKLSREYAACWLEELLTKLELPERLSRVHNTFHVSNLEQCRNSGREVKRLEAKSVPLGLKFVWELQEKVPEFSWELKINSRKKYQTSSPSPHRRSKAAFVSLED